MCGKKTNASTFINPFNLNPLYMMHAGFQEQIGVPNTMIWKYGKNKANKQEKIWTMSEGNKKGISYTVEARERDGAKYLQKNWQKKQFI